MQALSLPRLASSRLSASCMRVTICSDDRRMVLVVRSAHARASAKMGLHMRACCTRRNTFSNRLLTGKIPTEIGALTALTMMYSAAPRWQPSGATCTQCMHSSKVSCSHPAVVPCALQGLSVLRIHGADPHGGGAALAAHLLVGAAPALARRDFAHVVVCCAATLYPGATFFPPLLPHDSLLEPHPPPCCQLTALCGAPPAHMHPLC